MIKIFPLRVILALTTGRLLMRSKDGDLCEITDFTCSSSLIEQFPELAIAGTKLDLLDTLLEESKSEAVDIWLNWCKVYWGLKENYSIRRIK